MLENFRYSRDLVVLRRIFFPIVKAPYITSINFSTLSLFSTNFLTLFVEALPNTVAAQCV